MRKRYQVRDRAPAEPWRDAGLFFGLGGLYIWIVWATSAIIRSKDTSNYNNQRSSPFLSMIPSARHGAFRDNYTGQVNSKAVYWRIGRCTLFTIFTTNLYPSIYFKRASSARSRDRSAFERAVAPSLEYRKPESFRESRPASHDAVKLERPVHACRGDEASVLAEANARGERGVLGEGLELLPLLAKVDLGVGACHSQVRAGLVEREGFHLEEKTKRFGS